MRLHGALGLLKLATGALIFLQSTALNGQQAEEKVASRIADLGGTVTRDDKGNVRGVFLSLKPNSSADVSAAEIESIDFSALPAIRTLCILSPTVTNRTLRHLQTIPAGLEALSLAGSQVADEGLIPLLTKHKESLISVTLCQTSITDRTLSQMGKLPELAHLSLRGCRRITDEGLASLRGAESLEGLDLAATNISDTGLATVAQIPTLALLALQETKVTDAGLLNLAVLDNLEDLYVSSTKVTESGKRALQARLPTLRFK